MSPRAVLVFIREYLPGFKSGGPIRSVANLVDQLGDELSFWIITADRDFGDTVPYPGIEPGRWYDQGKAKVCYVPPNRRGLFALARLMRETPHDLVYLNSLFNPAFTTTPMLAIRLGLAPKRPVILAPRGEFAQAALALKSRKKQIFLTVSRLFGLHRGVTWQATSQHEVEDIRARMDMPPERIFLAPNLPRSSASLPERSPRNTKDPLRIALLGRISPMKNVDFALSVLQRVTSQVTFTIYGPQEDVAYWSRCKDLIEDLPGNVQVEVKGGVAAELVLPEMVRHDLFFLPTHGENFGHAISEAAQAGLPLLISDRTPWRDLQERQLGWDLPLDDTYAFVQAIETVASMAPQDLMTWHHQITQTADRNEAAQATLVANRALFANAVICTNSGDIRSVH